MSYHALRFCAVIAAIVAGASLCPAGEAKKVRDATKSTLNSLQAADAGIVDEIVLAVDGQLNPLGTIGVSVAPTDSVLRAQLNLTKDRPGVVVTNVFANSTAAKAGVKINDILLSANGELLTGVRDLGIQIGLAANKEVPLTLLRGGKTITVRIAARPAAQDKKMKAAIRYLTAAHGGSRYLIGVQTKPVDSTLAAHLVIPPGKGLVITHVDPKSPASDAGLRQHDVILTVADKYVAQNSDVGKALDATKGKPVELEFVRGGRKHSCTVTPKKRNTHILYWTLQNEWRPLSVEADALKTLAFTIDGRRLITNVHSPADLQSQINRLSQQLTELQRTLDVLRKSIPSKSKKK